MPKELYLLVLKVKKKKDGGVFWRLSLTSFEYEGYEYCISRVFTDLEKLKDLYKENPTYVDRYELMRFTEGSIIEVRTDVIVNIK